MGAEVGKMPENHLDLYREHLTKYITQLDGYEEPKCTSSLTVLHSQLLRDIKGVSVLISGKEV